MKILISPLDWGLGHATRCIPIIRYLLEKKCEVLIGADGRPFQLLKKEFPTLEFIRMPGYEIYYPENGSMPLKIAAQIPKIVFRIRREHRHLRQLIVDKKIDAVISDNRFGLWSRKIPCVFITHQIMVKSPFGEAFIHRLNKKHISNFSECWIPDSEGENNLSGDLAHGYSLPENAKYIGMLSRFTNTDTRFLTKAPNDILVILSGPEPQRTVFENKILEQVSSLKGKTLIVRGITENSERKKISDNIEMVSYQTSAELEKEISSAKIVLSRPGYSTIMDLTVFGKKAIFVPTPGQTEQEYLAELLMKRKIAYSVSQKNFDLQIALKETDKYSGFIEKHDTDGYRKAVDSMLSCL